jgi:hypothetical protein
MKVRVIYGHGNEDDVICTYFDRPVDAYDFIRILLNRKTDHLLDFRIIWDKDDHDQGGGDAE